MNWRNRLTKPRFGDEVIIKSKLGRPRSKEKLFFVYDIKERGDTRVPQEQFPGAEITLSRTRPDNEDYGGDYYKYSDIVEVVR